MFDLHHTQVYYAYWVLCQMTGASQVEASAEWRGNDPNMSCPSLWYTMRLWKVDKRVGSQTVITDRPIAINPDLQPIANTTALPLAVRIDWTLCVKDVWHELSTFLCHQLSTVLFHILLHCFTTSCQHFFGTSCNHCLATINCQHCLTTNCHCGFGTDRSLAVNTAWSIEHKFLGP